MFRTEPAPAADGWGPPASLPDMPPVPVFPSDVFPAVLADYWSAAADSLHVPADYVAVPALPLLGAAVGRAVLAELKKGYAEPPLLWCVLVAPPGRAKSPSLKYAKGSLPAVTRRWRDEHGARMTAFEAAVAKYGADLDKWKKAPAGPPPSKPERPTLRQLTLDKFTVEALVRVNAENPRGIVLAQDELAALVNGLNQYKGGRGDDRQTLLSLWAGAEVEVNRVRDRDAGAAPVYLPAAFAAVAGMIQPDMLGTLRGDYGRAEFRNDGWADRFLFSYPDAPPLVGETWATVPDDLAAGYAAVFDRLLTLGEDAAGGPGVVPFAASAREAWQEFTDGIAARGNGLDPHDNFVGVLSKLKHYGLRLSGLVHCVRSAAGEATGDAIDGDTVRRAARLVAYFEEHGRRCLGVGWADRPSRVAKRLLGWLARHPDRTAFSKTDAFLALKDKGDVRTSEALLPAFRVLADHNYVRPLDGDRGGRPGPTAEAYVVNPGWDRR